MAVPIFVHDEPKTTIINNIVYQDTVLNLKDLGQNLKITTIDNVSRFSLEACLKTIFSSNPEAEFNTVQYSDKYKKIYFYTNREISTKAWEDRFKREYQPLNNSVGILEEIKKTLVSEKIQYQDCISLYDVAQLLKKLRHDYDMIKKRYTSQLDSILENTFEGNSSIVIYNFNYKRKLLQIGFKRSSLGDYDRISFAKQNGDLYIVESKSCYDKQVFAALSSELSKLYDELISFADYQNDYNAKYNTKSVNSSFGVNISHYGAGIFVESQENSFSKDFKLFSSSYDNEYSIVCNSSIVNEAFKDKESEIFKRIFVKIDNCPEWSQTMLYDIRQKQLAEEKLEEEKRQKEENERQYQQMKKQKRLALIKKIFPFIQD